MKRSPLFFFKSAVIGTLCCVALLFALSYLINKKPQLTDNKQENKPLEISNSSNYLASLPDFGPLVQVQNIKVIFSGDTATGTLPNEDAEKVKVNKQVILYDLDGFTLPLGGKVSDVEVNEATTTVTIALPSQTNTEFLFNELDIITMETIASKRLPKSAYQQDDDNNYFVWRATPTEQDTDIYEIEQLPINIGLTDWDYFEEGGYKIQSSDLIILNPDENITADKAYHLKIVDMDAPIHNPIQQAWVNFEMERLRRQQEKLREASENCGKKAPQNVATETQTLAAPAKSDSCGGGIDFSGTDPLDIFNSLINTPIGN